MKAKVISTLLALAALAPSAKAQFYSYGNERGSLKWSSIETPTYRVVYPRGLDSLARVYAVNLEKVAGPVSGSIGYRPNEAFRKKMPVILHPNSSSANGMVTFLPRRMELQTNPEPYSPEVLPWVEDLTVHESRHVAQLQFTRTRGFRALNVLMGEFGPGALSAAYCGPNFFEGDAVMAETSLTDAGRGRSADFLEYMRVSFADGDWRDYWKWRYGSQNRFAPDHYKVGYVTMAGIRTLYDAPLFTKDYYDRIFEHKGWAFFNFQKTVREASGLKFKDAFRQIEEHLDSTWRAERALRAPFMETEKLSSGGRLFTEYKYLEFYGNSVLAVRSGIAETSSLVRVWPDGSEEKLHDFASLSSRIRYSEFDARVWWTEYAKDPRWSLESYSNLRYMDLDGKVRTLTRGHRYFNPAPSEDGVVAVAEYLPDGSEKVVTLDAASGEVVDAFGVPDGMQAVEPVWLDGKLYVSAISEAGFGIYSVPSFDCVLAPFKAKIKRLSSRDGKFFFVSGLGGVNEVYSYEPGDGGLRQLTATAASGLRQLTSTPDGTGDFVFNADTLYYTMLRPDGRGIYKTSISELQSRSVPVSEVDSSTSCAPSTVSGAGSVAFPPSVDVHRYEMAEKLSGQETMAIPEEFETTVSEPRDYSKLGHSVKVHSWLPIYFNCDDVSSLSYETIYQAAGVGATAFFQNELSTVSGLAGVQVDPSSGWRPSGHLKLTYKGLYPVFELQADFNDRLAVMNAFVSGSKQIRLETRSLEDRPRVYASLKTYVPLTFTSGGWTRGFIPQLNYSVSNDVMAMMAESGTTIVRFGTLAASLRGYTMKSVPSSCIYPRLGIGAEVGYFTRPGFSNVFCSNAYGYLYGYLPGVMDTHGIKLTAGIQGHVSSAALCEAYMRTVPRGFSTLSAAYVSAYPLQTKLTLDYALPFAPVDWSWMGPVAYVRNFELTLHGDCGFYNASSGSSSLFSVGADLAAHLGNLLWIPYDTRIGVSYSYLGGQLFSTLCSSGRESIPHSLSLLFSVDF